MNANEILNQISLIYKRKELIQDILAYLGVTISNNDINELLLIDTMDLLKKYSEDQKHFEMAMGFHTTVTDDGNYNFTAKMYVGKGINENDFTTRFSKNERTNLAKYYENDSNEFLNKYVNITGVTKNEIEILKRKLMLLSLRFHVTSIYPTIPVPLVSKGTVFGFQKMSSNLSNYSPGYNLNGVDKISTQELTNTINDFFTKNVNFFKVNSENITFLKSKIVQKKCDVVYNIFKQDIKPEFDLHDLPNITHKKEIISILDNLNGFADKNNMKDAHEFLNKKGKSGIIVLPYHKTDGMFNFKKYLVIVRFITKATTLTTAEEKLLHTIFMKKGISGLSEINETKNKLSWKYMYIADYIKLPDLKGFLATFKNGHPTELYWNDTATTIYKFLLALSLNSGDEIFMCPMVGNIGQITGGDIKIISNALKNQGNDLITIINKSDFAL